MSKTLPNMTFVCLTTLSFHALPPVSRSWPPEKFGCMKRAHFLFMYSIEALVQAYGNA